MSHLLFWPSITFFYPVGNTSAVCLTESLPPESKADILLLACGDPRHILYTIYADETNPLARSRTLDITCCDVDVAILARNALLLTLLADLGALDKLDKLWNLFYHMFVDQSSLSILFEQCRKLVGLAESVERWRGGPYGHFITTCDARTLGELRRVWTAYLNTATFSPDQARRFEQYFINGMGDMSEKRRSGSTATRSAGPFALHADQAASCQFNSYWSLGTTDDGAQSQGQRPHLHVNPTFAFSLNGDEFAVHYATDPLCGFHLAEAFASGRFTRPHEHIPPHEMVRTAKDQFSRWCTSAIKRLEDSNPSSTTFVVRMFAGDALRFCQAVKYCEVTRSPVTPYSVAAWRLSPITLDDHWYGQDAVSRAPVSFNVIDTSNMLDHVGLVNVLVVTAPLLRKNSSATLYTEALLRKGDDPSQAILEHVCGNLPTMALLLGIIPSTLISQFTTRSNVYENSVTGEGARQYHERLAWKAIGSGGPRAQHDSDDVPVPPQRLFFPHEELARFLFHVYVQMFSDEDVESQFQPFPFFSLESMFRMPRRSGVLHYNRRSFALLVHFAKTRIQTDWQRAMRLFEDLIKADNRLVTGQHAYQELCCHLHLLGVYTTQWMSVPDLQRLRLEYERGTAELFGGWTPSSIPQVVTLVLVVPHDAITMVEYDLRELGTPVLQCDMQDGPRQNWFAVTTAAFGTLRVSGTGKHRTGVVVEADADTDPGPGPGVSSGLGVPAMQPPWRTAAPLVIMFSIPSGSVMDFGRNPNATVGLTLRATPRVAARLANRLGPDLTVFRTKLRDAERVFVLEQPPGVGTSAGTTKIVASHWQEGMKEKDNVASGPDMPPGTSVDIHVQMNGVFPAIQSFTIRIDVTDPSARATLSDKQTVPTVNSSSGLTRSLDACLRIGIHAFIIRFPLPVDVARAKLRVARRSSYVEVVAPLAPFGVRPERDFSHRFAPLSLDPDDLDSNVPTLGSIHRLNLDRCPTFKFANAPSEMGWYDSHIKLMFSESKGEHEFLHQIGLSDMHSSSPTSTPDTLLRVRRTLRLLFRFVAGTTLGGSPERVFALCDTSRRGVPYLYIVVGRMCLDVGSHTVVADAFVTLGIPAVRAVLGTTLREKHPAIGEQDPLRLDDTTIRRLTTDADETTAWFHLLPRLTERCRAWPHKTSCSYRTLERKEQEHGERPGTRRRLNPLCLCGAGVGTEILPKAFEQIAPYLTRAAFSPLVSVPYLGGVDLPVDGLVVDPGMMWPREDAARWPPSRDWSTDVGMDAVRVGNRCRPCGGEGRHACSRCERVRYCSKACQRADWKDHKKDCRRLGPLG